MFVVQAGRDVQAAGHQPHGRDRSWPRRPSPATCWSSAPSRSSWAFARADVASAMPFHDLTVTLRRSSLALAVLVTATLGAQAPTRGPPQIAGRSSAAAPPSLGTTAATLPDKLQRAVDLRSRRRDRILGGHRGRRRLCRRAAGRAARGRPGRRQAALEVHGVGRSASASRRRQSPAASSTSAISAASCTRSTPPAARPCGRSRRGSEIKSSPVVVGDRVLIGSYDSHSLRARRQGRQARVEGADRGLRACARRRSSTASPTSPAATRSCARSASATARKSSRISSGAYTGASPAIVGGRAYYGTYENEVLAVDLKAQKIVWRYKHPDRNFPFYSSPAVAMATACSSAAATSCVHAIDMKTGKPAWTFTTRARVDSSPVVAGNRVYIGGNRRQALRARCRVGQERLRVRGRRPALGVARRGDGKSSSARRTARCSGWGREKPANGRRRSQRATSVARPTVRVTRMF